MATRLPLLRKEASRLPVHACSCHVSWEGDLLCSRSSFSGTSHLSYGTLLRAAAGSSTIKRPRPSTSYAIGSCRPPSSMFCCSRSVSTWASVPPWVYPAAAATALGVVAHRRWFQQQQAFIDSGACAAAADMLQAISGCTDSSIEQSLFRSKLHVSVGAETEYVVLPNPQNPAAVAASLGLGASAAGAAAAGAAAAGSGGVGDLLLFFHGGLCGSDQLLASGVSFPPNISHLLLLNRQGYLRSSLPPLWEQQQPQLFRPRRSRSSLPVTEEKDTLYRHRMRRQAALFNDVVRRVQQQQQHRQQQAVHLLGMGVGCAHAIAYSHFFPQGVRSISLVDPQLQLHARTAGGALEEHVLRRVGVYRHLVDRLLPRGATNIRVPTPKISGFEFLASAAAQYLPRAAVFMLLHATVAKAHMTALPSVQQLLHDLQQEPSLQQVLQQVLLQQIQHTSDTTHNSPSQGVSQSNVEQQAQQQQQHLYRPLLLRLQHATGCCYLAQRLAGFIEDCLLLWGDSIEASAAGWLGECFSELQVPRLLLHASSSSNSSSSSELQKACKAPGASQAPLIVQDVPGAQPPTLLLTHAKHISSALQQVLQQQQQQHGI